VEHELEAYKAQHRPHFQALLDEQAEVEDSLSGYLRRFEAWVNEPSAAVASSSSATIATNEERAAGRQGSSSRLQGNTTNASKAAARIRDATKDDPEIDALRTDLAAIDAEERRLGGPSGGWPAYSNENFLRILRMFKGQATEKFYEKLEKCFPDFSRQKLVDHVAWAADQEKRQAERKRLFTCWRARRMQLEREANLVDERSTTEEQERQRQSRTRERQYQDKQRRKVQEWREERTDKEQAAASMQRRFDEEQAQWDRQTVEEERRLRASQREACQTYRRAREQQRQPVDHPQTPTRRSFSQEDRQRIAHRNLDVLRRKLQAQTTPVEEGYPPEMRNRAYDAVESRLYNTTESSVQKKTTKAPDAPPFVPLPPRAPRPRPSSARGF